MAASTISIVAWLTLTAPQLSFINLSIDRSRALSIADQYLIHEIKISPDALKSFKKAALFSVMNGTDQYLQKAIGFDREIQYFKKFDYELFYWNVRYFREGKKEEYNVGLSAGTGEVRSYSHTIENSVARPPQTESEARARAIAFLKDKLHFDPALYDVHASSSQKLEHRTDYSFSWENPASKVTWSNEPDTGWAILHTGLTVSGDEILNFYKNGFQIPDQYFRNIDAKQNTGRNIAVLFRIFFYIILTASVYHVIVHRNNLVMHSVKNFAIGLTGLVFALSILAYFNEFEGVMYYYPTTMPMGSYIWRNIVGMLMNTFISVLSIMMPCLAGEALHHINFPQKKFGSFLHYLQSTFLSREVSKSVAIGYLGAMIMVGLQSVAFELGQRYLGVWIQYSWMAQLSLSAWPVLTAFILGATAGFSEEICFRFFGINIGKKFFKNTALACLAASVIWGYGHSGYLVYPTWFRSLEVSCLGLFLSFIYLRFGLIAVITCHYLFDVFWESSVYLFGKSTTPAVLGSTAILALPLVFAAVTFLINKKVVVRPLRWKLNPHQIYNLAILKEYLTNHRLLEQKDPEKLKHEIASHGWDLAVVEIAIEDLAKKKD